VDQHDAFVLWLNDVPKISRFFVVTTSPNADPDFFLNFSMAVPQCLCRDDTFITFFQQNFIEFFPATDKADLVSRRVS